MKDDKCPIICGDGILSRDFTYVENFAKDISGETFNIVCGERYTLIDLVNSINELLGNIKPVFEKDHIGDVKHSHADIEKAKSKYGFKVLVDFKTGLRKLIKEL
jgi:nucleoside-diphosphate-sugar epimerase